MIYILVWYAYSLCMLLKPPDFKPMNFGIWCVVVGEQNWFTDMLLFYNLIIYILGDLHQSLLCTHGNSTGKHQICSPAHLSGHTWCTAQLNPTQAH